MDPLYTAWLAFKKETLPNSLGVLGTVLAARLPKEVPRKTNNRGGRAAVLPQGVARHNLFSAEWMELHERDAIKSAAKKSKDAEIKTKN